MITKFVEVIGTLNWGKFMLGRFSEEEWGRRSVVDGTCFLGSGRGWAPHHLLVLDIQTGEGAIFRPGGSARADLEKHKVWVCPMFEPFLEWLWARRELYENILKVPDKVELMSAPPAQFGYRRPGVAQ